MHYKGLCLIVPLVLVSACSRAPTPREFLIKAIQGDNSEMRLGMLAATKGGPAVAQYGQTLEADHAAARAAAVQVAARYGITPPGDIVKEASSEYAKLDKLSGNDFDKEFASYMIEDHKHDIEDFTKASEGDAPADVKALARAALPTLQKHLALANSLK